jgi:hypothetical protein
LTNNVKMIRFLLSQEVSVLMVMLLLSIPLEGQWTANPIHLAIDGATELARL